MVRKLKVRKNGAWSSGAETQDAKKPQCGNVALPIALTYERHRNKTDGNRDLSL